jgi:hexosaminidase
MQSERLNGPHQLQVYFTNRMAAFISSWGRRAIGWNEILQPGLAKDAVVHYWAGSRREVVAAARDEGRQVVVSPFLEAYLDHSYSPTPLSRAYHCEPVFPELAERGDGQILGLEACLWAEFVPNQARLDYQTYPRLPAYAETGWTPRDLKAFSNFRQRLPAFLHRLDRLGVRYAPLKEAEPGTLKQLFGIFTILFPQTRVAG